MCRRVKEQRTYLTVVISFVETLKKLACGECSLILVSPNVSLYTNKTKLHGHLKMVAERTQGPLRFLVFSPEYNFCAIQSKTALTKARDSIKQLLKNVTVALKALNMGERFTDKGVVYLFCSNRFRQRVQQGFSKIDVEIKITVVEPKTDLVSSEFVDYCQNDELILETSKHVLRNISLSKDKAKQFSEDEIQIATRYLAIEAFVLTRLFQTYGDPFKVIYRNDLSLVTDVIKAVMKKERVSVRVVAFEAEDDNENALAEEDDYTSKNAKVK